MSIRPRLIAHRRHGFLGPFVVRALRERFPDACSVPGAADAAIQLESACPASRRRSPTFGDGAALHAAFADADVLVNLASLGFDWIDNIVRSAEAARIRRAIFMGTTAILTALPVASKPVRERGEQLVRDSRLAWTILRPTMIYGTAGDRNIARLVRFVSSMADRADDRSRCPSATRSRRGCGRGGGERAGISSDRRPCVQPVGSRGAASGRARRRSRGSAPPPATDRARADGADRLRACRSGISWAGRR